MVAYTSGRCTSNARLIASVIRLLLVGVVSSHSLLTLSAQVVTPAIQQGLPINTSNDEHGVDSVNTMGLGLHIEIPLLTLQEHGQPITWKYVYDTPTYEVYFYAQPTPQNSSNGNFAIQAPGSVLKPTSSDNWRLVATTNWQLAWDTLTTDP